LQLSPTWLVQLPIY